MTSHDELLARLDDPFRHQWGGAMIAATCEKAAVAIRDLTAKLEAERKLRNPQEWLALIGELRENAVAIRGGHGGEQFDADLMDRAASQLEVALSANEAEHKAREDERGQWNLVIDANEQGHKALRESLESRIAAVFELLQRWVDFHTKSAEFTVDIIKDDEKFKAHMAAIESNEKSLVEDTIRALAPESE